MAAERYLYGDINVENVNIALVKSQEIGYLSGVAANGDHMRPSETVWSVDTAGTQTAFAAIFYGVSLQKKEANKPRVYGNSEDGMLSVATSGTFEITLQTPVSVINGVTLFAPGKHPSTNNLIDTDYAVVASLPLACFIAVETKSGALKVRVRLKSTRLPQ